MEIIDPKEVLKSATDSDREAVQDVLRVVAELKDLGVSSGRPRRSFEDALVKRLDIRETRRFYQLRKTSR